MKTINGSYSRHYKINKSFPVREAFRQWNYEEDKNQFKRTEICLMSL